MATGMLHSHTLFVVLFTLIYLIKTILLLSDKDDLLEKFKKKTKVLEMIVSFGFLATGIYLMILLPEINMFLIIKIALVLASIPLAVVGYKKKNKVLATLSFFLIIVAFGLAQKAKNEKAGDKIVAVNAVTRRAPGSSLPRKSWNTRSSQASPTRRVRSSSR